MDGFTIHPVTLQPPKLNEEGNVEEQEEEQQSGSKKTTSKPHFTITKNPKEAPPKESPTPTNNVRQTHQQQSRNHQESI